MSDYFNPHAPKQTLPEHLATPEARAQFIRESSSQNTSTPSQTPNTSPSTSLVNPGEERVYIENNRARPVHFLDENGNQVRIDGQITTEYAGPFLAISKSKLESMYHIHAFFETKIKGTEKMIFSLLTPERFRRRWAEHSKRAELLTKKYANDGSGSSRHSDGTIDEDDQRWEDFKILPMKRGN